MQFFDFTNRQADLEADLPAAEEAWQSIQAKLNEHAKRKQAERKTRYTQKYAHQPFVELNSGHKMPLVGYGTWSKGAGDGSIRKAVETAVMAGYRHIDCAAYYKNEKDIGKAINHVMHDQVVQRQDLFVVSKLWNSDHGYTKVRPAVFRALRDLQVTYLDLFLIHWPVTGNVGAEVEPRLVDTWRAMEDMVSEGLVKSIGVANFSAKKLQALLEHCTIPPAVNQVEVHPFWRNDKLIEWCAARKIHVTAYSPLGSPDSESLLRRGPGPKLMEDPTVCAVAEKLGKSPAQVLIRWAIQHGTSVLPKSTNPGRIEANAQVDDWEIPAEEYAMLCGLSTQTKMVDGSVWVSPQGPYKTLDDLWDYSFLGETNDLAAAYKDVPALGSAALNDGRSLPLLGYGTWKSEPGQLTPAVIQAVRAGYRHIDCAEYYKNEHEVGEALSIVFAEGVVKREDVYVVSKLWNSDHGGNRVRPAVLKSLKSLRLDYLDLYLIHWPVTGRSGDAVQPPLLETWQALETLVREGLVKSIGVANFSAKKLQALLEHCTIPPAVNQVEVHPFWRNDKLIEWCAARKIHVTAYSPLGSPDSESLLRRGPGPKLMEDPTVCAVAEKLGKSPAQVLIRWAIQHGTSVLPKSTNPGRIEANAQVDDWEIPAEEYAMLCGLSTQTKMVDGRYWVSPRGPYKTLEDLWDDEWLQ